MNFQLQSNTVVFVGVAAALGVGAYLLYRRAAAAGEWVSGLPARVVEAAKEGGQAFQDANTPNDVNWTNSLGSYNGVFNDPLINSDGMDFRYF